MRRLTYRPRQLKGILDGFTAIRERNRKRIIISAPTGFGKTGIGAGFIEAALRKGRRVLFLADRKKLVRQAREKLREFGIESGIIMAGHPIALVWPVQVASVKTLIRRIDNLAFVPDIIIVDEAHRANGESFLAILNTYPDAIVIGLTATACRTDGTGLGKGYGGIFEEIIPTASVKELIEDGTLCPFKYYLPELMDTSDLHVTRGDIDVKEFDERMDAKPGIVGDFVSYWLAHAKGRPTLVFASSLKEAGNLCEATKRAGIRACTIDASSSEHEGDSALAGLTDGTMDMIIVVGCFVEGMDCEAISCVVLMMHTESITKFLQTIGRGFRFLPGKTLMIIDHMGNAGRLLDGEFIPKHGMPDWTRTWSLEGRKVGKGGAVPEKPQPLSVCAQCWGTFIPAPKCPECGFEVKPKERKSPEQMAGKIVEISEAQARQDAEEERLAVLKRSQEVGMANSYEELLKIARDRGYNPSWAGIKWAIKKKQAAAIAARREAKSRATA